MGDAHLVIIYHNGHIINRPAIAAADDQILDFIILPRNIPQHHVIISSGTFRDFETYCIRYISRHKLSDFGLGLGEAATVIARSRSSAIAFSLSRSSSCG